MSAQDRMNCSGGRPVGESHCCWCDLDLCSSEAYYQLDAAQGGGLPTSRSGVELEDLNKS